MFVAMGFGEGRVWLDLDSPADGDIWTKDKAKATEFVTDLDAQQALSAYGGTFAFLSD